MEERNVSNVNNQQPYIILCGIWLPFVFQMLFLLPSPEVVSGFNYMSHLWLICGSKNEVFSCVSHFFCVSYIYMRRLRFASEAQRHKTLAKATFAKRLVGETTGHYLHLLRVKMIRTEELQF